MSDPKRLVVDETGDAIPWATLLAGASQVEPTNVSQDGNLTVGATQVEIAIGSTSTRLILLRADPSNTNTIWIGKTGVKNDGTAHLTYLEPGDDVHLPYNNATNALYAISDAAAQTLSVGALI
jgi:hypothetical protein